MRKYWKLTTQMHKAEDITQYEFNSTDQLLLDTNVWLFLYGPQTPRNHQVDTYSQAYGKILAARSRIYIDVLIISEFINAYARIKWKSSNNSSTKFKRFRNSKDFKAIAKDIAGDAERVLQYCTRVESGFDSVKIDSLIEEYGAGSSDFNDQILTTICRKKRLKLVTDDGDFRDCGITIITANQRLLV